MAHRDLIVIGASMGGVEALTRLVAQLPADLAAAVCIVLHVSATTKSVLPAILSRSGPLPARHPDDHEALRPGHIYVAPNDRHLLVEEGVVRVVKGPRENGHRPAVDPLFRSAARTYGPRVVGVVLTGALDCGTAGLIAVKRQGGLAIVQEPADAYCPDMPRSALEYVQVDHCVPLAEMGALLAGVVSTPLARKASAPQPRAMEEEVKMMTGDRALQAPPKGEPSHYSCPDCGGVLFEMDEEGLLRYRCRTGHGFTGAALAVGQQRMLDDALWAAVRALEENAALARRLAANARQRNHGLTAVRYDERAQAAEQQALLVREAALNGPSSDAAPADQHVMEGQEHRFVPGTKAALAAEVEDGEEADGSQETG
jgi:two-component system chemotaxis response regulator CheB